MATWLKNLRLTEISFVDKGANPGARVVITKRDESKSSTWRDRLAKIFRKEQTMPTVDEILAKLPDAERAVIMSALEAAAGKKAADAPAGDPASPEDKPMAKRDDVPEDVRKQLTDQASEIAKMKAEKRRETFIAKAKALPFIPGKVEDTATLLEKAADSMKPEDYAAFEKKLGETNAALSKSAALKELGSSVDGGADSAKAKVEALADAEITKSAGKVSRAQAIAKVLKQNPGLYNEYERERSQAAS